MSERLVQYAERIAEDVERLLGELSLTSHTLGAKQLGTVRDVLATASVAIAEANGELWRLLADLYDVRTRDYNSIQSTLHTTGRRRPW